MKSIFAKARVDKVGQGFDGCVGVIAFGGDAKARALGRGEHEHLHDGLAIDGLVRAGDGDGALESRGDIDERHRRPGVQAKAVLNRDISLDSLGHGRHLGMICGVCGAKVWNDANSTGELVRVGLVEERAHGFYV